MNVTPHYQEFHIKVAGKSGPKEVFKEFPSAPLDPPELVVLKQNGIELARAWFCRSQKTALRVDGVVTRGFRMRIRNFAVGPTNIYSDEDGRRLGIGRNTELRTTARLTWFCGEVYLTNHEILPNTPRDGLEVDATARFFIEELRGFYKERIADAGAHSDFNSYKDAMAKAQELIAGSGGLPVTSGSIQESERTELLGKLEDAGNKTKGDKSGNPAGQMLKNLLSRKEVREERMSLIAQLKALAPKTTRQASGAARRVQPPEPDAKSLGATTVLPTPSLKAEELFSEIVQVLERHLGQDHDELAPIAEDIRTILQKYGVINANESLS